MNAKHLTDGSAAEAHALARLQQLGWRLVAKNYRTKRGEIDLIMLEGDTLVFVEVRYRRSNAFGGALESVTLSKQKKIIRASKQFMQEQAGVQFAQCRFDVLAVSGAGEIDLIHNAFQ